MNELLSVMQKNKKLKIEIQGHICCAPEDFGDLSTARARAVYDYLIKNGISGICSEQSFKYSFNSISGLGAVKMDKI